MSDAQDQGPEKMANLLLNVPDMYTNNVRITASVFEIAFDFWLNTQMPDGASVIRPVVRVRMSPQQAVALKVLLDKYLKRYGEQFQEIFLPDEMVKRLLDAGEEEHDETT